MHIGGKSIANLKCDKVTTALLVIDPYNDFISEGGKVWDRLKGVAEANQCVPHLAQVLDAAVADEIGCSLAQVALAWLRSRPVPVIPIIGARKLAQLQDNFASFNLTLSSDQVKMLDEASWIDLGFSYDLYAKELPRTFMYGGMRDQILT